MAAAGFVNMNMDESVVTFGKEGILSSSVLIPMGIRINKPTAGMRIREVIEKFNETYLETMDFLTQILPLAREQFGRSDNVLLPKTPAKKRYRKAARDFISEQENTKPCTSSLRVSVEPPKRTTRSASRNNPPENQKEPVIIKKKRGRKKKSSNQPNVESATEPKVVSTTKPNVESTVTFVDESQTITIVNEVKTTRRCSKNLKRSSSTSPVSVKPVRKKSRSSNDSFVKDDTVDSEKQTSTPIGSQSLSVFEQPSISLIIVEPELKSSNSELVVEKVENKVFSESLEDVEKMDVECSDDAHVLVEISDGGICSKVKTPEVVLVPETPPSEPPQSKLPIKPEASILAKIDETSCEFPDETVSAASAGVDEWSFHSASERSNCNTEVQSTVDKTSESSIAKVCSARPTDVQSMMDKTAEGSTEKVEQAGPTEVHEPKVKKTPKSYIEKVEQAAPTKVQPTVKKSSESSTEKVEQADPIEVHYPTVQKTPKISIEKVEQTGPTEVQPTANKTSESSVKKVKKQPNEIQPLRRSQRLSRQISYEQMLQSLTELQSKEKSPEHVEELQSTEEPTLDSPKNEAPEDRVIPETPEIKPVRRSSRRVSRVSTGLRRSCRRSSRLSRANFKRPVVLKQIEVNLNDVGINKAVVPVEARKAVSSNSEHSSTESEDEGTKQNDGPKMSRGMFALASLSLLSSKTGSTSEEVSVPSTGGKVAGLVHQINTNNLQREQSASMCKTPNQVRKIKRLGSAVQGSSVKLSNLVGGNIKSFIKPRQSVQKKLDANEAMRQRKLELQRKDEKERERKDQVELRKKKMAEEQKRKREEKQKRVAETKAAKEREEQDKKQRQLAEKKQTLHAMEQARKKKELEEEAKRKQREQRTKEAEAKRRRENEERLKRLQEKEVEDNMYRDMMKRKQEHDEQERKQKIQEEKRLHEQKQRERQREQEEERERRLREIKEREAKRTEKDEIERKLKEESERKETEEKERKRREQEERERKRIAQLIKDKMEQEKKLHDERQQKEEKERREREANKILHQARTADSYLMTPPPALTRKPSTAENYDISDIRSDESTDDEDCPRKKVPDWAKGVQLKGALLRQEEPRRMFEDMASGFVPHAPDLEKIFTKKRKRFYQRGSSAHWATPPIKV